MLSVKSHAAQAPRARTRVKAGGTMDDARDAPSAGDGQPVPEAIPLDQRPTKESRPRHGFGCGLAIGAAVAVIVGVVALLVSSCVASKLIESSPSEPGTFQVAPIVVTPAQAGVPWFSISATGTGTLKGWNTGEMSSLSDGGTSSGWPSGTIGYFDVGAVDVIDGVAIRHEADVYLTSHTQITLGTQPYTKGSAPSAAEAALDAMDNGPDDPLSQGLLTIEFHRVGNAIVADRITEPVRGPNPLQPDLSLP